MNGSRQRQAEGYGGPGPGGAGDVDGPVMSLDDVLNNTHPHAQAAHRGVRCVGPVELVEDPVKLRLVHAGTLVQVREQRETALKIMFGKQMVGWVSAEDAVVVKTIELE